MLRKQAVELFPDTPNGQVHFCRAIMESAAEVIETAIPEIDALTTRIAELTKPVRGGVVTPDDISQDNWTPEAIAEVVNEYHRLARENAALKAAG
jgi:hypothetical protein